VHEDVRFTIGASTTSVTAQPALPTAATIEIDR